MVSGGDDMRSVSSLRKIDELGRVVIPYDMRNMVGIQPQDLLEIYVENGRVVVDKFQPGCIFCDEGEDLIAYRGVNVCRKCRIRLGNYG